MSIIHIEIQKKLPYPLSNKGMHNMQCLLDEGEMKDKIIQLLNTDKSNFLLDDKNNER